MTESQSSLKGTILCAIRKFHSLFTKINLCNVFKMYRVAFAFLGSINFQKGVVPDFDL